MNRRPDSPGVTRGSSRGPLGRLNVLVYRHPLPAFLLPSLLLYGNTVGHKYALDDGIVILENTFTKQGIRGIPLIFALDTFVGFLGQNKRLVQGGRY